MVEEGGRGKKKKKIRFGGMDVCECEGAVPGARRLCHPSRRGDTWAGPPRAHCGSPSECRGHLLPEAVNFPPTSRAGGRVAPGGSSRPTRQVWPSAKGSFGEQQGSQVHGQPWGCPAPRDAWGHG